MQARHLMGQEKYGPIKFTHVNTLKEAREEVIDLANYALYTYIKLCLLDEDVVNMVDDIEQPTATLGTDAFVSSHEGLGGFTGDR
jgi:hypothetical protein